MQIVHPFILQTQREFVQDFCNRFVDETLSHDKITNIYEGGHKLCKAHSY